jgi:hypothetical protein
LPLVDRDARGENTAVLKMTHGRYLLCFFVVLISAANAVVNAASFPAQNHEAGDLESNQGLVELEDYYDMGNEVRLFRTRIL